MAETENKIIRTIIVEDQRDLREGLQMLINFTPGFKCLGAFRTMEEALARIKYDLPDVVLSDIGLPGMSGIEGIRILKEKYPELVVLGGNNLALLIIKRRTVNVHN